MKYALGGLFLVGGLALSISTAKADPLTLTSPQIQDNGTLAVKNACSDKQRSPNPSVRLRNHCARALSFWNNRKRQASWIRQRRTRALPDLARPFSRRLEPLSSGAPVSPA